MVLKAGLHVFSPVGGSTTRWCGFGCPSCSFKDCPRAIDKDAPCDVHSPLDQTRITELFNKSPRYATLVMCTRAKTPPRAPAPNMASHSQQSLMMDINEALDFLTLGPQ